MPSARITDQQVSLYMNSRKKNSQVLAAAKAGISERSARRIEGATSSWSSMFNGVPQERLPQWRSD